MEYVTRQGALARGLTDHVLRGKKWQRVSCGLYLPGAATPEFLDRVWCLSMVMPGGAAFSGLTAARLYGWWLPPLPDEVPIFVTVNPGCGARPGRSDLRVRRAPLPPEEVGLLLGVPVTTPVRTLLDLAEVLPLIDLVVVADAALHAGDVTIAELKAVSHLTRRGIRIFRGMTGLADPRSESPWETMLRLLHVLCGIPVEVQVHILDAEGDFIARADLCITGTRRLPEYDGATHRERERHQDDLRREKLLARAGYERYGYIAREICTQPEMIIGDAEDALGWPMQTDRLDGWLAEFDRSLFSRRGMARWAARWC